MPRTPYVLLAYVVSTLARHRLFRPTRGAAALALAVGFVATGLGSAWAVPQLVNVRGAGHVGFDRVVFEFRGGLPRTIRLGYVPALIQDASGRRIPMPGRAILDVQMKAAYAHDKQGQTSAPNALTLPLRNAMRVKRAGDFEATVSYGIGLAKRRPFRVMALRRPDRIVVDIDSRFHAVRRKVWFMNFPAFQEGRQPDVTAVSRWVPAAEQATGVMDRLFAGPTAAEAAKGLRFVASHATGFAILSIINGLARLELTGGCANNGSTFTIANEIQPTLQQFPGVTAVKIYDPNGATETPSGPYSSIPFCLEP